MRSHLMLEQSTNLTNYTPLKTRLKVLHIIWWGELGGVGLNLADLVGQLDGSGHTIDICVIQHSSRLIDSLSSSDVHITEIGARSGFDLFAFFKFCRFLRRKSFDIIHDHAGTFLVALGILLAGRRARKVCQEHGAIRQHYRGAKKLLFYRMFRTRYHQFVAVSNATAKDLVWAGVPYQRVVTIPNPVDTSAFSPNICRGSAKERIGLPQIRRAWCR